MIFYKTSKDCEFIAQIKGFHIEQSDRIKYLGVVLDDKLNSKKHLSFLKSKLLRSCYILSKHRCYLNTITLKLIIVYFKHIRKEK